MAVKQWPALQQSHLSLQHIVDCIQRYNCIAIALVDNHVLCCPTVTDPTTTTTTAAASVSNNNPNDTYVGHYVVLVGVSDDPEHMRQAVTMDTTSATAGPPQPPLESPPYSYCLVVHNPASSEAAAAVSYWTLPHFERSWRAHGTDDDIIFVVKHYDTSVEPR
jgi:Guanylylate cyclase